MPVDSASLAGQARQQARHILSQPPFSASAHRSGLDRFFHDLGHWLSDVFGPVWRFLDRHLFHPVHAQLSSAFGSWWPVPLGVVVVVTAAVVGLRLARTRARVGVTRAGRAAMMRDEDPGELERAADRAEQAGDYELAVRLRFRAGLARLERSGLITGRRTHTSSQLAQVLRSPTFDTLAGQLDRIVYAGLPATADHVVEARSGWPRIPVEARESAMAGAVADQGPPRPAASS